jgi:hypothetical protein
MSLREFPMKTRYVTKNVRSVLVLLCVFAPILMVALAAALVPHTRSLLALSGLDWTWLMLLAAMMLGLYYFLVVFVKEESEVSNRFRRLDRDNDGYISVQDAEGWPDLRKLFDKFDVDHDGRMSRADFDAFQRSIFSHQA